MAHTLTHHTQRGNVFFYILIAIALFAALSYAVARSSQTGGGGISDENARLYASQIIGYSNVVQAGVAQLRLRGVDDDQLCFDHAQWGTSDYDHSGCDDDYNAVFSPSGAGVSWKNAPSDAMDQSASPDNLWHIYADNEIEGIGTTSGDATSSDLVLVTDELSQNVCQRINGLLEVTDKDTAPPTDTDIGETFYIGSFGYTATIGDEAGGSALDGQTSGCFENTTDSKYVFYKVLIAR